MANIIFPFKGHFGKFLTTLNFAEFAKSLEPHWQVFFCFFPWIDNFSGLYFQVTKHVYVSHKGLLGIYQVHLEYLIHVYEDYY